MPKERNALTTLCGIVSGPDPVPLEAAELAAMTDLVEAARRGEQVAEPLRLLLDHIGLDPGTSAFRSADAARLGGVQFQDGVERYACPAGRCDRSWLRVPGRPIPRCALAAGPLLREET